MVYVAEIDFLDKKRDKIGQPKIFFFGWVVSEPVIPIDRSRLSNHKSLAKYVESNQLHSEFQELASITETSHLMSSITLIAKVERFGLGLLIIYLPLYGLFYQTNFSEAIAMKHLSNLKTRLRRNAPLHYWYSAFICWIFWPQKFDEVKTGHINNIPTLCPPNDCVTKDDSTIPNLLVIFCSSPKTTSNFHLNDCLLFALELPRAPPLFISRFWCCRIALPSDVTKVYRQIQISVAGSGFHRLPRHFDRC